METKAGIKLATRELRYVIRVACLTSSPNELCVQICMEQPALRSFLARGIVKVEDAGDWIHNAQTAERHELLQNYLRVVPLEKNQKTVGFCESRTYEVEAGRVFNPPKPKKPKKKKSRRT